MRDVVFAPGIVATALSPASGSIGGRGAW